MCQINLFCTKYISKKATFPTKYGFKKPTRESLKFDNLFVYGYCLNLSKENMKRMSPLKN